MRGSRSAQPKIPIDVQAELVSTRRTCATFISSGVGTQASARTPRCLLNGAKLEGADHVSLYRGERADREATIACKPRQ